MTKIKTCCKDCGNVGVCTIKDEMGKYMERIKEIDHVFSNANPDLEKDAIFTVAACRNYLELGETERRMKDGCE